MSMVEQARQADAGQFALPGTRDLEELANLVRPVEVMSRGRLRQQRCGERFCQALGAHQMIFRLGWIELDAPLRRGKQASSVNLQSNTRAREPLVRAHRGEARAQIAVG